MEVYRHRIAEAVDAAVAPMGALFGPGELSARGASGG